MSVHVYHVCLYVYCVCLYVCIMSVCTCVLCLSVRVYCVCLYVCIVSASTCVLCLSVYIYVLHIISGGSRGVLRVSTNSPFEIQKLSEILVVFKGNATPLFCF